MTFIFGNYELKIECDNYQKIINNCQENLIYCYSLIFVVSV